MKGRLLFWLELKFICLNKFVCELNFEDSDVDFGGYLLVIFYFLVEFWECKFRVGFVEKSLFVLFWLKVVIVLLFVEKKK